MLRNSRGDEESDPSVGAHSLARPSPKARVGTFGHRQCPNRGLRAVWFPSGETQETIHPWRFRSEPVLTVHAATTTKHLNPAALTGFRADPCDSPDLLEEFAMSDAVKVGFVPFATAVRGALVVFCDETLKFGPAATKA